MRYKQKRKEVILYEVKYDLSLIIFINIYI